MSSDTGSSLGGTGMSGPTRLVRLLGPWSIAVEKRRVGARVAAQCEDTGVDGAPRSALLARAALAARFT